MKKIQYIAVLFFLCILVFLTTTTAGLLVTLRIAGLFIPGKLSLSGIEGSLFHGFSFAKGEYRHQKQHAYIEKCRLDWSLERLSYLHAHVRWGLLHVPFTEGHQLESKSGSVTIKGMFSFSPKVHVLLVLSPQSRIQVRYDAKAQWIFSGQLVPPPFVPLKTTVHLKGHFRDKTHGTLSFVMDKGSYTVPDSLKPILFEGARGLIQRQGKVLSLRGDGVMDARNQIQIRGTIPNLDKEEQSWLAEGRLRFLDMPLDFSAKGTIIPAMPADIHIQGHQVPVFYSEAYQGVLSPDLFFHIKDKTVAVNGTITVPKAMIQPQSFHNTEVLSHDVSFVDEKPKTSLPLKVDVEIVMGNAVQVKALGLNGRLEGSLFLKQELQKELTATGELHIVDGTYKAYGQDLIIGQGRVFFTGGALDSPQLALRASKVLKKSESPFSDRQGLGFLSDLTVGVDVSGELSSPNLRLFSEPASLSQADILSYLLLGKPVSQANKAGGQLLLAALSSMGSGTSQGQALWNQVQKKLDMDIHFENATQYNQATKKNVDSRALVVGKSLSKRLYVSYNMGLAQADVNVLTLKYLLSKFFSLQVNASTGASGIDLLYTKE